MKEVRKLKLRKVMIHIESVNNVPIEILREKRRLELKIFYGGCNKWLRIDQIMVQVVKPEKK